MKKLSIDMDLLLELSSFDTRGTGQSFINIDSGDISYIPKDIMEFIKNNTELYNLEEWQIILLEEARDIHNHKEKYIYIPLIEREFVSEVMIDFVSSINDKILQAKLLSLIEEGEHKFNMELINHNIIEEYYDYKDMRFYEYLINWLNKNGIILYDEEV